VVNQGRTGVAEVAVLQTAVQKNRLLVVVQQAKVLPVQPVAHQDTQEHPLQEAGAVRVKRGNEVLALEAEPLMPGAMAEMALPHQSLALQ
tara:strand:+ start:180 stop:449 length:270 start_codon:yes stop_codon:yes gene_type:complete